MRRKIDYQKELNPAQYDAVSSTEGPFLLIAGAGSGKTRVLVYRTAYLVEQGINPQQILLLTFTRRSAREMLDRASHILDDRCQRVAGGTFHSFANFTLRRYAEIFGLPRSFTILDQDDAQNAVDAVRTQMGLNKLDQRFPKKQTLLSIISKSFNKDLEVESIIYEQYSQLLEWADVIQSVKEEYVRYKRAMGLVDYDDLLLHLRELLDTQEAVRKTMSRQYRYIMVDEFQDTNKIQADILQLLTQQHQNIMVVGDDAQSIYSFRGAHFKNIMDFPNHYSQARVILLEENYRSSQPILDLTNEVIQSAEEKYDKALFTNNAGHSRPTYVNVAHENGQSRYIVRKIIELQDQGVPLREIAVLFRSGYHSNDLEVELAHEGIPFLKYGGQKFADAAHIKDALSYLRVAYNPRNEVSWSRILMLMRGIGQKTAGNIIRDTVQKEKAFQLDKKFLKKNADLKRLFELFQQIDIEHQKPEEILHRLIGYYYPIMVDTYDDYDRRQNDLDSLLNIVSRYTSLEEFLADMALDPPEKSIVNAREDEIADSLVLSTIHSAKGLEWHTVFLIYVAEGFLPSYRSLDDPQSVEEERRLFYVATTRAKERLFLVRPVMNRTARMSFEDSGTSYTRISRFLEEGRILRDLVDIESDDPMTSAPWSEGF